MPPKISIVVPVHNVAPYLPSCIESVIDQRHDGVEIVLVDDRSTDGSRAICDRYAAQNAEVRVVHLAENVGVAQARNEGLAAARGDHVLFLDGDDALTPGSLRRLSREIDRIGQVDVVICRYMSESGVLSNGAMFLEGKLGRVLERDIVLAHLTEIDFYLDHCWPFVISRALIERHGVRFINSMIAEDAEYIVRILTLASSVAYCDGDFYLYRERAGSLKGSKGAAATASFLQVAHAMQQLMDTVAHTEAQVKFVASQINHAFGVFATRLSLLDDAEVSDVGAQVTADHLPRAMLAQGSDAVAAALMSYREATERATELLVAAAKGRPVYIYCAGPGAEAVIGTLQRARHDVRAVVDDNLALAGGRLLGVLISRRSHRRSGPRPSSWFASRSAPRPRRSSPHWPPRASPRTRSFIDCSSRAPFSRVRRERGRTRCPSSSRR